MKEIIESKKGSLFICTLAFTGEIIGEISWAFLFKIIFDLMDGKSPFSFKNVVFIAIFITTFRSIMTFLSENAREKTTINLVKEYKNKLMNNYLDTDSNKNSSEMMNLLTHTTAEVEQLYIRPFLNIIKNIIFFVGSLCAIFYLKKLLY
ncbi:MAG: hypothetical protein SPI59_05945 [Finegoldia sp.]|nr:hypothetical protein [Finegoldia sp.]